MAIQDVILEHLTEMKGDVGALKADVATIKTDLAELKAAPAKARADRRAARAALFGGFMGLASLVLTAIKLFHH